MLAETYRPKSLAEVAGHRQSIARLQSMLTRPSFLGGGFLFQGPSGCGKTTIAHALARSFCDERDINFLKGADVLVETVRDLAYGFHLSSWGESGWKAAIVDEAHAMSPKSVQDWLTVLEPMKPKRLVCFTTTERLDTDIFGNFTMPFASRCHVFTLAADMEAFKQRALHVANQAGYEVSPETVTRWLRDCKGNLRTVLNKLESDCNQIATGCNPDPAVSAITAITATAATAATAQPELAALLSQLQAQLAGVGA